MDRTFHELVIAELYEEALTLADEARAIFDPRNDTSAANLNGNACIAKSIEGLRTTTRLMQVIAWLLNQRAYFGGELTKLEMLRHGPLGEDRPSDPANMKVLPFAIQSLIRDTQNLHARVKRLDEEGRHPAGDEADPVRSLQGRIQQAFNLS